MIGKIKALIPLAFKFRLKAIVEYGTHAPDIILLWLRRRKRFAVNLISGDRRVTFVSDAPTWREMKLAYGLRRAGWEVTLLYGKQALNLRPDFFHDAQQYQSPWEALELAHRAPGRIIHNFSHFGDQTSIRLLRHRPAPVIYDFYDSYFSIFDGLQISPEKKQLMADQLHCIEKADALCCRDLQMQYRRKEKKFGRGKPVILFPEYCWDKNPLPPRRSDSEVHIVQIGWIGLETLGEMDTGGYPIFERLVNAGCHLHFYRHPIYPPFGSAAFEAAFADYIALREKTGRVHFHPTVSPEMLSEELAKYDFGASVNSPFSFDIPWTSHNIARVPHCGSSRLYDYLDAGLAVITHRQLKLQYRMFQSYGIVQDVNSLFASSDLKAELVRRPDRAVFQRARTDLSIDSNIGRLTQFYEKLR